MLALRVPVIVVGVLVVGCREQPPPAPTPEPPAAASAAPKAAALVRVEAASHVCMVNDRYMGSEQIPVTVDGRTYYGCCASCKEKLESQVAARTALDPVTRNVVDKATAVIGRTATGKVMYFESAETLARFSP